MKSRIVLLSLLFFPALGSGQQTGLNFKVLHSETTAPVAYAAIFDQKGREGGYADEQGLFVLEFGPQVDTLLVSAVGFETLKIACATARSRSIIHLKPVVFSLPDVTIAARSAKYHNQQLGYFKRFRGIPTYSMHTSINNRFALLIRNPSGAYGMLEKLSIRFDANPSQYASTYRIRLRVYQNEAGKPGQDLLYVEPFEVRHNQQSLEYRLETEKVVFPPEGLFIGYDVLGYSDKAGVFYPFKRNQQKPTKQTLFGDHLCPGIAIWQKATDAVIVETFGTNPWRKFSIPRFGGAPMFGLTARFK